MVGYPLDTVKVKIQTQVPDKGVQYRGTFHCLTEIVRENGVGTQAKKYSNFFNGTFLRLKAYTEV